MKNILLILVGVLVVGLSVLAVSLNREIKKTGKLLSEKEQLINEKENLLPAKTFREGEILFNGKKLSKETSITDGKGNIIEWDEITDNDKLVFYFSETSCDMCVDMEITRLNEKADWTVSSNTITEVSHLLQIL
jgi:hypothetical protein